ncbi:unnamed protein product [Alopecurus aequalis]
MDFKLHLLEEITNNFSKELKVGSGGYGDVYRAVHDGKQIAVKKIHPLQGLDDKAFDNEYRNLIKINHPNVVQLIGYCHESRMNYVKHDGQLVMATIMERILCFEYMEGGGLDTYIKAESCDLDWPTCYKIIRGTCEGINHLHSAQDKPIFHLDLKPANILLDKEKKAKIADLGLSKLVSSTQTYQTKSQEGTRGYMPPEYIDAGNISRKFDVFSLGIVILKIMAGNEGYYGCFEMPHKQFTELVCENWMKKVQATPGSSSNKTDIVRVKACVEIALRCVKPNRNERPFIKEIVQELEELEAEIEIMSQPSIQSKDVLGQKSSDSNILAVDPTLELRFPFEARKDISCCLQLTNKTDDYIAFNIKTDQKKYNTQPSKGIMRPCSKCYISVTLRAQEEAPLNMQCHDMFLVQNAKVSENLASDEVTEAFFKKLMVEKVVDVVKLPIVYVALGQFLHEQLPSNV